MVIDDIFRFMPTKAAAAEYLQRIRWGSGPVCAYCDGNDCRRHKSHDRDVPRWHCRTCNKPFSVTVGTIFHGSRAELRQWYQVLVIEYDPLRPIGAYLISKDTGLRRPTVSTMLKRIREADAVQADLLNRIVQGNPKEILA